MQDRFPKDLTKDADGTPLFWFLRRFARDPFQKSTTEGEEEEEERQRGLPA